MVTIKRYGEGTCCWCACEAEGVDAEFKDGLLKGFLCRRDFWRAVQIRQQKAESLPSKEAVPVAGK